MKPAQRMAAPFDVERYRRDFPALRQNVHGHPLVYLDNAATAQKPRAVLEAMTAFYEHDNANVHRGVHALSERATAAFEGARRKVQRFLHASRESEIVFTRGATEAINLVAQTYGKTHVKAGDQVLVTAMEHHSNIVPWQMLCEEKGARLEVLPINDRGELELDALERMLTPKVRICALAHISNALGTVNPVRRVVELCRKKRIPVLVDGAQAVPHLPVDVQALGCDFYAFSGHKLFGPTGIGALYGRQELLEEMPPYQGGGDMIASVTFAKTVYNRVPFKFEAGTPDLAGAVGLGAAIDYVTDIGLAHIHDYEQELLAYGTRVLESIPGLKLYGTATDKAGVLSFLLGDIHPHDVGTVLDQKGIAVRTGHHCAQPVMERFGIPATVRASLAFYNTQGELDALVAALREVVEVFA